MRALLRNFLAITMFTLATVAWSCGQNGPTVPAVSLSWTQSSTTGVTSGCVYRCLSSGTACTPAPPAVNINAAGTACSAGAITSYLDTTVTAGDSYYYAVTAKVGSAESGYSNVVGPEAVPSNPASPSNLNAPTVTQVVPDKMPPLFRRPPKLEWDAKCYGCREPAVTLSARIIWGNYSR